MGLAGPDALKLVQNGRPNMLHGTFDAVLALGLLGRRDPQSAPFYALDRAIPYPERMIDSCLALPRAASSACLDVDPVDILAHLRDRSGHRRDEIDAWLAGKLEALLAIQNPDGGFPDEVRTDAGAAMRRLDGWVGGYREPQGLSNTFATHFRIIAIAMILTALSPGRARFGFRRTIGIGYAHPALGRRLP